MHILRNHVSVVSLKDYNVQRFFNVDLNITECGAIIICCAEDYVICCMAHSFELTLGSHDLVLEGGQRDQFPCRQCISEQIFRVCE